VNSEEKMFKINIIIEITRNKIIFLIKKKIGTGVSLYLPFKCATRGNLDVFYFQLSI